MITLSTEEGLITVDSWDDIISRPRFKSDVDPNNKQLKTIIGRYLFKDKIRCGLSDCHTPHNKGYIVITTDGIETNIGKDCGKKYFSVNFETEHKRFDRLVTEQENRSSLASFSFTIENIQERLEHLQNTKKGKWVHKFVTKLSTRNPECPDEVVSMLSNMIRTRDNVLKWQRLATKEEIETIEAAEGKSTRKATYKEEPIAEIAGIAALYNENNLRQLLILDVGSKLDDFQKQNIDQMSFSDLQHWTRWAGTVEATLTKAEEIIEQGHKLLDRNNLEPLLRIIKEPRDRNRFTQFLNSLQNR